VTYIPGEVGGWGGPPPTGLLRLLCDMIQKTPPFVRKATLGHYRLIMRVLFLPSAASLSFTVLLDFALSSMEFGYRQ